LKDVLVKDDSNDVMKEARNLLDNLTKINIKLLTDNKAHNHWMSFRKRESCAIK